MRTSRAAGALLLIPLAAAFGQPELLTGPELSVGGRQYVAALHADLDAWVGRPGLIAGVRFHPARPGQTIVMLATGCGEEIRGLRILFGGAVAEPRVTRDPARPGIGRLDVMVPEVRGDSDGDVGISRAVDGRAGMARFTTVVQSSELAGAFSAAFREFGADGSRYADLHKKFFGVTLAATESDPPAEWIPLEKITPESSLDRVLRAGEIRMGYVPEFPLHYAGPDDADAGFEFELGEELVKRIAAHYPDSPLEARWVKLNVTLPMGPSKESTLFNALLNGLRGGQYDVAFNGVLETNATVAYTTPTSRMFPGVLYTGKDELEVSGIHDRPSLVNFLIEHPGLSFVVGMGQQVLDALAADVKAGGGSIVQDAAGSDVHFRMADILGLTKQISDKLVTGVLLDVNPRLDFEPKAPFTLPD
jgi:ABC-type amino acid transport substrate-binding protein